MNILLIEDNPGDARLVQLLFERGSMHEFYTLSIAETVEDAQRVLVSGTFELVLLDLGLPGGRTHQEVFEAIRKAAPNVPIVIVTGLQNNAAEAWRLTQSNQAIDYIRKEDLNQSRLMRCIKEAIDQTRYRVLPARLNEVDRKFDPVYGAIRQMESAAKSDSVRP